MLFSEVGRIRAYCSGPKRPGKHETTMVSGMPFGLVSLKARM